MPIMCSAISFVGKCFDMHLHKLNIPKTVRVYAGKSFAGSTDEFHSMFRMYKCKYARDEV